MRDIGSGKRLLFAALLLASVGFMVVQSIPRPAFGSRDPEYFSVPPSVVKKLGAYFLRWNYGSLGFVFQPSSMVKDESLVFYLMVTTSSGNLPGRPDEVPIDDPKSIAALERGGAFWWEPDGSLSPLTVVEDADLTQTTPRSPSGMPLEGNGE